MAKYEIKHTCGHTITHDIYGTNVHGERDNKVMWLTDRYCADCYKAQQLKIAQEANVGLPSLTGSDKQVAWAETIRATKIAEIDEFLTDTKSKISNATSDQQEQLAIQLDNIKKLVVAIKSKVTAKYWIDNRGSLAQYMLRDERNTK